MIIPCENCLVMPSCRHKSYKKLVTECQMINDLLYVHEVRSPTAPFFSDRRYNFDRSIREVILILRPVQWEFKGDSVANKNAIFWKEG